MKGISDKAVEALNKTLEKENKSPIKDFNDAYSIVIEGIEVHKELISTHRYNHYDVVFLLDGAYYNVGVGESLTDHSPEDYGFDPQEDGIQLVELIEEEKTIIEVSYKVIK